jgi:hypothetical protein
LEAARRPNSLSHPPGNHQGPVDGIGTRTTATTDSSPWKSAGSVVNRGSLFAAAMLAITRSATRPRGSTTRTWKPCSPCSASTATTRRPPRRPGRQRSMRHRAGHPAKAKKLQRNHPERFRGFAPALGSRAHGQPTTSVAEINAGRPGVRPGRPAAEACGNRARIGIGHSGRTGR